MTKYIDFNAKKALDEMKLEMANDLDSKLNFAGVVGGTMTKRLVEIGQKQLLQDENPDTFNPS